MAISSTRKETRQSAAVLTGTILTVVIVGFFYWARAVVIPLALAIFLTFILSPIVIKIRRWHIGRVPAVILVVGLTTIITIGVGGLIYWQVAALVQELPDHREKIGGKFNQVVEWVDSKSDGRLTS